MRFKAVWAWILVAVAVFATACGGGGGGSSSNGGSTGTTITGAQVTAVLAGNSSVTMDTTNLTVGDQVQLMVLGRNQDLDLVTVPGSNWSTTAPSTVATVTSSGLLTAVGSSGGKTYTISGTGPTGTLTANLIVNPVQAIVTGKVRNVNNAGIQAVVVNFYNSSGTKVARSVTGADGTFRASVPATAKSFSIDMTSADISGIYYAQFGYGDNDYLNGDTTCLATLPKLTTGNTTPLPNDIVPDDRASGPPPPPTGCVGG